MEGGMERSEQPWNSSYTYQVSKHSAEMLHNLNSQRKDGGRFCDVILRVGEESFPAHKAVLAACSEYFESVFSCQGEGDTESKELEMHTISPKVFRDILDFAYTSKIVVRLECFPELMTAAKFLLMRSVIEICQEVIKQSNVQILVPPSRGGELSFLSNAMHADAPNGAVFTNRHSLDSDSANAPPPITTNSHQIGLPVSPSAFTNSPVNGEASPNSKRIRVRPKKEDPPAPGVYNNGTTDENEGPFPGGLCGKMLSDAVQLRNHEAQRGSVGAGGELVAVDVSLTAPQPQNCVQTDGNRKRERTRRHVGCDLCGKVFRDVYHLNRHKLSHSGEKPYACPVCGLRFKRKDRMSYHVRSHDGAVGKPYVCQNCGKGFSRPDHLNGHIKQVHTTERPHKCQICNASFATRDRLRSHLACHEDKIPCQVCGKYLRAAYMTDHLKKHSEGPHNYCSICNKAHQFPEPRDNGPQMHNGAPYHSGRQCAVEDLCTSRRILMPFPEAEGCFRGFSGSAILTQPGPPALGVQPELWERHCGGAPGLPLHAPLADGQENAAKCPHQDSEGSGAAFEDLSNGNELKLEHKAEDKELEVTSLIFNGEADSTANTPCSSKQKTDMEKKFACGLCGQTFRTKSYLNKHQHRVHKKASGTASSLGDLGSPFSPQQNMSLLESFGFQIVQSAFASSLVDSEVGSNAIGLGDK
ncbi:POZ-, AT hook-, and zinc finger-containing protein 1 isoform X2 [Silurus meridionalis]|uniref:POZ-, AT hook-, and zinc finger-containing protein 1 isoform X2 n=1 Tax=Silurus meridionalis TaxID=175797 RepID=UPI001EEA00B6|nr:POZ-, AT hook-, and zinc finger-containing protein 1 isoform X2 [Silurus meridionalis]